MIIRSKVFLFALLLILLFDGVNNWCLKAQFSDSAKINSIDFSKDGSKIVTASDSNRVIVWDAHTLEQLFVYNFTVKPYTAKFSKDNTMIAIGGARSSVHVLSVAPGYPVITTSLSTSQTQVFEVDFNEGTSRFVTCGQTNIANLY